MQVILADLSQLSAESLPDIPELEARIRTLQLPRRAQPPYESVVAIFTLLRGVEQGIEKGVIIGRIRTLQEVLQQPVASQEELVLLSHDELQLRAQQLQGLLKDRPA